MTPVVDSTVRTAVSYIHKHWPSWLSGGIGLILGVLLVMICALSYELCVQQRHHEEQERDARRGCEAVRLRGEGVKSASGSQMGGAGMVDGVRT